MENSINSNRSQDKRSFRDRGGYEEPERDSRGCRGSMCAIDFRFGSITRPPPFSPLPTSGQKGHDRFSTSVRPSVARHVPVTMVSRRFMHKCDVTINRALWVGAGGWVARRDGSKAVIAAGSETDMRFSCV